MSAPLAPESLVNYESAIPVGEGASQNQAKAQGESKPPASQTDEILNAILPPRSVDSRERERD